MAHKHKHKSHRMRSLEEMDNLYSMPEAPINPVNGTSDLQAKAKNDRTKMAGWKYYDAIRIQLPEWWESFNGDLDLHGRLKHVTIRAFIKTRTNKRDEQAYLYQMLGPCNKRVEAAVPWLGDWEKRRRNGFGVLDSPEKIKPLLKVIKENLSAVDAVKGTAAFLLEDLAQYSSLQSQVHEAFAGRAFLNTKSADDKKNVSRFEVYRAMLKSLTELKFAVIKEYMRIHGVHPDEPQTMRDMVAMAGGIGAAAALTGVAAGQTLQLPQGFGGTVQTPGGPVIAPYTYDALKLAEQLTKHAHAFKKPLPPVIDAQPSEYEERKSKGNGKVV